MSRLSFYKSTDELLDELHTTHSLSEYFEILDESNSATVSFTKQLNQYLNRTKKTKAEIISEALLGKTYGYELFSGEKIHPARDYVIRLAFALELTHKETNRLLVSAHHNELYARDKRDAIIIFCINHKKTLNDTEAIILQYNEEPLLSDCL